MEIILCKQINIAETCFNSTNNDISLEAEDSIFKSQLSQMRKNKELKGLSAGNDRLITIEIDKQKGDEYSLN